MNQKQQRLQEFHKREQKVSSVHCSTKELQILFLFCVLIFFSSLLVDKTSKKNKTVNLSPCSAEKWEKSHDGYSVYAYAAGFFILKETNLVFSSQQEAVTVLYDPSKKKYSVLKYDL